MRAKRHLPFLLILAAILVAGCPSPTQPGTGDDPGTGDQPGTDDSVSITTTANNGTVAVSPDQATYDSGAQVILTATADSGYIFDQWTGGSYDGSTDNPLTVTVDADLSITAVFVQAVTISGYVTDFSDGGAIADATVSMSSTTTTTDTDGSFALVVPLSSTAADLMVTKSGRATTCAPGVVPDESVELSLPNHSGFNSDWATDVPTVSTTLVSAGDTISGIVALDISSSSEIGLSRYFVYLQDGPFDPDWAVVAEYIQDRGDVQSATHHIDTTEYPNGDTELVIVAFDFNDNATVLTIPVTIDNAADDTAVPEAVTTLNVTTRSRGDRVWESVDWSSSTDADGYEVYRRVDTDTDDVLVGRITSGTSYSQQNHLLVSGQEVTYIIKPYNSFGAAAGIERSVTPIPSFDVTLETPANNVSDVALAPTFTWNIESATAMPDPTDTNVSASGTFSIWDTEGSQAYSIELADDAFSAGTHTSTTTLAPGYVYSWDLTDCSYRVVYYSETDGYSVAESLANGTTNGEHLFVTTSNTGQ